MTKTKQKWLFQLRKCSCRATLEKVIEKNHYCLPEQELENFNTAADHRLAEIITSTLYDKVPASLVSVAPADRYDDMQLPPYFVRKRSS
ncbi:TPA: hemolysin activation protein [Citrobacter farmeri]|nr:hemolysin activation protein [Citrobacter farmeri]